MGRTSFTKSRETTKKAKMKIILSNIVMVIFVIVPVITASLVYKSPHPDAKLVYSSPPIQYFLNPDKTFSYKYIKDDSNMDNDSDYEYESIENELIDVDDMETFDDYEYEEILNWR